MASAVCLRVEPLLAAAISPDQRGFLPGRSMLLNVVDVDTQMRLASFRSEEAATFFFDFATASTSISHDFARRILGHLDIPAPIKAFVKVLYAGNGWRIAVGGSLLAGFPTRAGIRPFTATSGTLRRHLSSPLAAAAAGGRRASGVR